MDPSKIPGAILKKSFEESKVWELKRWLRCRSASTSGLRPELIQRCKVYSADPIRLNNVIDPDKKPRQEIQANSNDFINDGTPWTRSLELKELNFGEGGIYRHMGGDAEKHRVSGYQMFKCGKVENLLVKKTLDLLKIKANVAANMSMIRYQVSADIEVSGLIKAKCNCKAGATGRCKHVGAVLFQLNDYRLSNIKERPEVISSTQKPKQWGVKKSKPPTISSSFQSLNFVKYIPGKDSRNIECSKKRKDYSSLPPSKLKVTCDELGYLEKDIRKHEI